MLGGVACSLRVVESCVIIIAACEDESRASSQAAWEAGSAVADPEDWLDGLSRADLLGLVRGLVSQVDGAGEWLALRQLRAAHARAVCGLGDTLPAEERRRIAEWLVKYRYGGKQDFFDPDIVSYAPGLGDVGVARYRSALADQHLGRHGRYPEERLAVLDGDLVAIVAAHGGEPANARSAEGIVEDLLEAGLVEESTTIRTNRPRLAGGRAYPETRRPARRACAGI